MFPEKFKIKLAYGDVLVEFELRMISIEEENSYIDRLIKLDRKDKQKEYELLVDAVAAWSSAAPIVTQLSTRELVNVEFANYAPADAVKSFFGEYSLAKERFINQLLALFRKELVPSQDFL